MEASKSYLLAIPRIGLALVFLWFGFQQLKYAESWIGYVPETIMKYLPISPSTFIHFNGAFEVVFGIALIFGICTRLSIFLLGLHLAEITYSIGLDSTGVRDFGVVMGSLFVFLYGPDELTIDKLLLNTEESSEKPMT